MKDALENSDEGNTVVLIKTWKEWRIRRKAHRIGGRKWKTSKRLNQTNEEGCPRCGYAGTHLSVRNGKPSSFRDSLSIFLKALSTADLISSKSMGFIAW